MSTAPVCPCDAFVFPPAISNPPGLDAIAYRIGDFQQFREALLRPLPGEVELLNWRPSARGDLGLQMLEWWAYLADVLAFYNERIANESYLGTAVLPESVNRLIRIIGYRPRPGIGATGVVAALLSVAGPIVVPQGFPIQSKAGPGKDPQVFEVDEDTPIGRPDALDADPAPSSGATQGSLRSVLLQGTVSGIKMGGELLLMKRGWPGSSPSRQPVRRHIFNPPVFRPPFARLAATRLNLGNVLTAGSVFSTTNIGNVLNATPGEINAGDVPPQAEGTGGAPGVVPAPQLVIVQSVFPEKDPRGKTNTRVTFAAEAQFAGGEDITDYRLLRSTQSIGLWPAPQADPNLILTTTIAHAISINRQLEPRTPLVIDVNGVKQVVSITTYSEAVWFANADHTSAPDVSPDPTKKIGVPIPHSVIEFTPALAVAPGNDDPGKTMIAQTVLRFAFQDAGQLIGNPVASLTSDPTGAATLTAPSGGSFPEGLKAQPVLLEDADLNGAPARVTSTTASTLALTGLPALAAPLIPPLQVLLNLLPVSRGKTVAAEILGSGDATVAGQEFMLQKSPLTYLATTDPAYPDGYKSTLRVWVNGVEWLEAPGFYGQPANARIFVTREDAEHKTHVRFGDGIHGLRLPTGSNNVQATYRYGSGGDVPDAGKLTVITQPLPGLRAIHNPVPPGGGADPDSPQRIRRLAPRTTLTFGRAVSGDDYEVMAAQTPGVARARAYWSFDSIRQRTAVALYVGDMPAAVDAAKKALARSADPNRPVIVQPANPVEMRLDFILVVDPAYQPDAVKAAVTTALLDPDTGLFGLNAVAIGEKLFRSQIEDACLRLPGAAAVHSLVFALEKPILMPEIRRFIPGHGVLNNGLANAFCSPPFDPGEGGFFKLPAENLTIATEVATRAR